MSGGQMTKGWWRMSVRSVIWLSLTLTFVAAWLSVSVVRVEAQRRGADPVMRIWNGSYTDAQADRGEAAFSGSCSSCHSQDLSGGAGPALAGPAFMSKWELEDLSKLFRTIKDTMPRNAPGTLTDETAVDLVAHILRKNAFPVGMAELSADPDVLETFTIVPKTGPTKVVNFALVQTAGCLVQTGGDWMLEAAGSEAQARNAPATAAELEAARTSAPGTQTFRLVSVMPFKPSEHQGERVHIKGIINRDTPLGVLLNVTDLQPLGPCQAAAR